MHEISLATVVHDPAGTVLPGAAAAWDELVCRFGSMAVAVSAASHPQWVDFLEARDVTFEQGPSVGGSEEGAPCRALRLALTSAASRCLFYLELPTLLEWLEADAAELNRALMLSLRWDCLVIGRTEAAMAAAPRHRRTTEAVINQIFRVLTGRAWDVLPPARGLSRAAAELVVDAEPEGGVPSHVAWPLLCEVHGLRVGYTAAECLHLPGAHPDGTDEDAAAWIVGLHDANAHAQAINPYLEYFGDAPEPMEGARSAG